MATFGSTMTEERVKGASSAVEFGDVKKDRDTWDNQFQFIFYCLGYAVGFGNIWRFPYLCYKNGGAAFVIPYLILLLMVGLPIFFMELALGQYISLGWGMVAVSFFTTIYFNVIIAWTFFYTFSSFTSEIPWSTCDNDFNSVECFTSEFAKVCRNQSLFYYNTNCLNAQEYCSLASLSAYNTTHCFDPLEPDFIKAAAGSVYRISASEDFFRNRMLGVTGKSWENMGGLRWELVGCLALAWVIVGACLIKGIKTTGKIAYFTALFPYIVLVILFIRGITLDGAYQGIEFYLLKPNVTRLMEVEVWGDAAGQIIFSLGICFGCLITLSSYNKFNNNCMRDAVIISFSNCTTSVFIGLTTFSVLGFLAKELGVEIEDVVTSGSGLAFVVYPAALSLMPLPQIWSVLFFFMLITIGLGSQFTMVETVTTALVDQFEGLRHKKGLVVVGTCLVIFLMGVSMCLEGGILMFELFFFFAAGLSMIVLGFVQLCAIQYFYGFKNLVKNIEEMGMKMTGPIYCYWTTTWLLVAPAALLLIGFFSVYTLVPAYWRDYVFPFSIQVLGWFICFTSVACVPLGAFYAIFTNKKSCKSLFETSPDFCPASHRQVLKAMEEPSGTFRYIHDNEGYLHTETKVIPGETN
ncbi:Sodium- and chloride-dependent glycine transporter 1-like 3 [Homarus americanus]|uniref:Transporter n=1 Tax=Homarus americanus TaxID=6706 RepID=A0A8J5JXD3_HOMAM|nr:Sodium- and chloride-dependent glycine transporter 1-like 3 [Homarus americanus]